jgi:RecJ-like exonuclease
MKRSQRSFFHFAFGLVLAAVGIGLVGCNTDKRGENGNISIAPSTIGVPVSGEVPLVCTQCLKTEQYLEKTVTIEGEVIQQCPAAGCWFRLKDELGEGFIDLSPAKLTVQGERVGQHAKVTGKVVKKAGQMRLEAEYVEFSPLAKDHVPAGKQGE